MILASPEEFAAAYTAYHWHEGYRKRARLLVRLPDPILVVGCGFGFLVAELQQLGRRAYGIDASSYCRDNRVTDDFAQCDILRHLPPLKQTATVVTEDMLPWLTDSEAVQAAKNCALITPLVLHLVTESGQAGYNYHSCGYWMTLTGQLTIPLEGM